MELFQVEKKEAVINYAITEAKSEGYLKKTVVRLAVYYAVGGQWSSGEKAPKKGNSRACKGMVEVCQKVERKKMLKVQSCPNRRSAL